MRLGEDFRSFAIVLSTDPAIEDGDWDGYQKGGWQDWEKFLKVKEGQTPGLWWIHPLRYRARLALQRILASAPRRKEQRDGEEVEIYEAFCPEIVATHVHAVRYGLDSADNVTVEGPDGEAPLTFETDKDKYGDACLTLESVERLADLHLPTMQELGRVITLSSGLRVGVKN